MEGTGQLLLPSTRPRRPGRTICLCDPEPAGKWPAAGGTMAAAVVLALATSLLPAQTIREVRVAAHSGFVRVVFESDGTLEASTRRREPGALEVRFAGAAAASPVLHDPDAQLAAIDWRRDASSLVARLQLGFRWSSERQLALSDPDRLVVDLIREAVAADTEIREQGVSAAARTELEAVPPGHAQTLPSPWIPRFLLLGVIASGLLFTGTLSYALWSRRDGGHAKRGGDEDYRREIAELDSRIRCQLARYRSLGKGGEQ